MNTVQILASHPWEEAPCFLLEGVWASEKQVAGWKPVMQIFCEKCLWRIERDSRENKWALRLHWGSDPCRRAPAHAHLWESAAGSSGIGEEVHAEQEQSSSGTSLTSARSVTRSNKSLSWTLEPTQRRGSWRPVANSTRCSRQSWSETWTLSVKGFHVGRA